MTMGIVTHSLISCCSDLSLSSVLPSSVMAAVLSSVIMSLEENNNMSYHAPSIHHYSTMCDIYSGTRELEYLNVDAKAKNFVHFHITSCNHGSISHRIISIWKCTLRLLFFMFPPPSEAKIVKCIDM